MLDVQHAYEHDKEMNYAKELFDMSKNRLVHFHVSGETENEGHSLVCKSDNKTKILDFVRSTLFENDIPIILEGNYKNSKEIKEEVELMKRELFSSL